MSEEQAHIVREYLEHSTWATRTATRKEALDALASLTEENERKDVVIRAARAVVDWPSSGDGKLEQDLREALAALNPNPESGTG